MSILFITSNRIGDAVLSTGLLNRLLEMYPDDGVCVAAGGPCAALFEAVPRLLDIHTMTKRKRGGHWFELWRKVARHPWRAVIDIRRSALPWTIRVQHRYVVPRPRDNEHRVESLSRALGAEILSPTLWTNTGHEQHARQIIGDVGDFITIAPSANWIGKTWPSSRFADLATMLADAGNTKVLIVGAEPERAMAMPVFLQLGDAAIDGIGIGLLESFAAIRHTRLFIGNDSGLMHLAAASGVPTVGLFGPSNDRHYAPWGENGLVVRTPESLDELTGGPDYDYRNPGCMMESLQVDTVIQAIRDRWPDIL